MKKSIALLAGGNSSEREISLQSASQVEQAIDTTKYDVYKIDLHGRFWKWVDSRGIEHPVDKNDFSIPLADGGRIMLDYALILIHGTPGEDGKLQGYLEMMGVPFSSCSQVSSVITFDKATCKRTVEAAGIRTPREILLLAGDNADPETIVRELGMPVFVKPNASGSSFGVSKVKQPHELAAAIETAFGESGEVLIEEYIEGRELACGVMAAGGKEYVFPVTELLPKNEFFDYEAKYTDGLADEITPADLKPEVVRELNDLTLRAYRACRCRGLVRIDFILRGDVPYLIEVNSIPGMSRGSIVPKQIRAAGMTLAEVCNILIGDALPCENQLP